MPLEKKTLFFKALKPWGCAVPLHHKKGQDSNGEQIFSGGQKSACFLTSVRTEIKTLFSHKRQMMFPLKPVDIFCAKACLIVFHCCFFFVTVAPRQNDVQPPAPSSSSQAPPPASSSRYRERRSRRTHRGGGTRDDRYRSGEHRNPLKPRVKLHPAPRQAWNLPEEATAACL